MQNPYSEEPRLNRFLLLSVVLHAILFFTLPNLDSLLQSDIPGMAGGGIIQVMHVETSVNTRQSPITDRLSQTTVPKVTEPRPLPEQPPQEQAIAQPKAPEVVEPQVEQAKPVVVDEPQTPEPAQVRPEPIVEESGRGEVLTSPTGPEVVVESAVKEVIAPPTEPRPAPETKPPVQNTSGSGTGTEGSNDNSGVTQSGTGTAPTAPPAPPPPPSGRSIHLGGGSPLYPKNAEHDGVEVIVLLLVDVSSGGVLQKIALGRSSGDERLDLQALRYIQSMWTFQPQPYDYSMKVEVIFRKEDNRFVTNLNYGEVKWLNAP